MQGLVVGYSWNAAQMVTCVPGMEFESFAGNRRMHGGFRPIDVHNALIAAGPAFRSRFIVSLPSGKVNVALKVARLLGLDMSHAAGRVLNEALVEPVSNSVPAV